MLLRAVAKAALGATAADRRGCCLRDLLEFSPPALDLLLPMRTGVATRPAGYVDWLIAVFERWYSAPRQETPSTCSASSSSSHSSSSAR
jgi:hypothetical protein